MSKTLRGEVAIRLDVNPIDINDLVDAGLFSDRDSVSTVDLYESSIPKLENLKASSKYEDEAKAYDVIIDSIKMYGVVNIWIGF